jgi:hypothetical protein
MKCKNLILQIPYDLRFGQSIFNFLSWCQSEGLLEVNQCGDRLGDPYSLPDKLFLEYWEKWLNSLQLNLPLTQDIFTNQPVDVN